MLSSLHFFWLCFQFVLDYLQQLEVYFPIWVAQLQNFGGVLVGDFLFYELTLSKCEYFNLLYFQRSVLSYWINVWETVLAILANLELFENIVTVILRSDLGKHLCTLVLLDTTAHQFSVEHHFSNSFFLGYLVFSHLLLHQHFFNC